MPVDTRVMTAGIYALVLELDAAATIEIGAMGEIEFEPGVYVYVGSAMNSVEKRLERHFSRDKKLHWHIDYFTREADPVDAVVLEKDSAYECMLADALSQKATVITGFGSSDCDCESHLFRFPTGFSG